MSDFVIYISCPPLFATGGTELLHQLCFKLNKLGFDSKMCYSGQRIDNPTPDRFMKYNVSFTYDVEDSSDNFFVVPEVSTDILVQYSNVKKVIWWLSVDNFFALPRRKKIMNLIYQGLGIYKRFSFNNVYWKGVTHWVQSNYAKSFLERKGIKSLFLSDYLGSDFLATEYDISYFNRRDVVLYNPKKGFEFTRKIMGYAPDIEWIALENMTPLEVGDVLKTSKVYVDFGNHPGKDRFPREAAISGCCVITGMRGSASFYEDVPILDSYKFKDCDQNIPDIVNRIRYCLSNFSIAQLDFEVYRDMIRAEEASFEKDILAIFHAKAVQSLSHD